MEKKLIQEIRAQAAGKVLPGEPLARHTTYRVGGAAEVLVCPRDAEDAARVYSFARLRGVPLLVLGAGSNVIAPDEGIAGVVLKTASASARIVFLGGRKVRAEAGVPLIDLVRATAARGLAGLEPLAGIPGTVGGAVVMNAGTRDVEVARLLSRIDVITSSGRRRLFAAAECSFGYRRSVFLGTDWLVLGAEFKLGRGDARRSLETIDSFLEERESQISPRDPERRERLQAAAGDVRRPPHRGGGMQGNANRGRRGGRLAREFHRERGAREGERHHGARLRGSCPGL